MDILHRFSTNSHVLYEFAVLLIYLAGEYPVSTTNDSLFENRSVNPDNNEENLKNILNCTGEEVSLEDVIFLNDSDIFLKTKNITVHSSGYQKRDGKLFVWHDSLDSSKNELIASCDNLFSYDSDEFQTFLNCSVSLYDDILLPGECELQNDTLYVCDPNDASNSIRSAVLLKKASIYISKIGCAISIVALTIHLLIFCCVPTLQNLPGYNLASLSVALLFAYSFVLIGQIPEVLGLFCIICGVLQLYFFLVAFFCMNIMAFDVWRSLSLTTKKLILGSRNFRKRQFLWYSLYVWGYPFVISSILILLDNIHGVPEKIKPYFGGDDFCLMKNSLTKTVFFAIPAFTLFIINILFFIRNSVMISSNTMQCTNEDHSQAVKFNYFLYLRLGVMMGLTWLIALIGTISKNDVVWLIHNLMNSLYGLFLLLLFIFTKNALKHLNENSLLKKIRSRLKQTPLSPEIRSTCVLKS